MLNRYLSLLVSGAACASAAIMLFLGTHPAGFVSLADRAACIGLALVAAALGIVHLRIATARAQRSEAAMWCGLALFFCVSAFASPHLGLVAIGAAMTLAATSAARLFVHQGRARVSSPSPFRRRIFT